MKRLMQLDTLLKSTLSIFFFLLCFQSGADAWAEKPFSFGPQRTWHVFGGLTSGVSIGDISYSAVSTDDPSANYSTGVAPFVGGALSVSTLKEAWWAALHADAVYNFGLDTVDLFAGPGFGYAVFGFDTGVALALGDPADRDDLGPQARLSFGLGVFSLYGRHAYYLQTERHVTDIGITLKLPLWASE